jgi:DNA polymerase-3 subunit delta'
VVGPDGTLPLPWLAATLRDTLQTRHAHALLLCGPRGVGQFEFAVALAQAWLCEGADVPARPCGQCASCRLVQARTHPDLLVLLPDAMREPLGWEAAGGDEATADKGAKTKPSKEIKVEAVRAAVSFAQTTSARGRCKVVVVHPAERMNGVAANTLLKTLEEPPGAARFVLACAEPDALLATIRSRCQAVPMTLPPTDMGIEWLAQHGVAQPAVLLAAAGGQPQEALEWAGQGLDAASWTRLPGWVQAGDASPLAAWPLSRVVDALQKLCHDASCVTAGMAPRYFPAGAAPSGASLSALCAWSTELVRAARHVEHPWHAGLMMESLVRQGQEALAVAARSRSTPGPAARDARQGASVHSRP